MSGQPLRELPARLFGRLVSLAYRLRLARPRFFSVRVPGGQATLRLWVRRDSMIERQLLARGLYGGWERVSLEAWACLARRSGCVLDLGANTGVYSLLALAVNPAARVLAVEPVPANYEVLQRNVAANGPGIVAVRCAVSDREGTATLHAPRGRLSYISSVERNRYADHPELAAGSEVVAFEAPLRTVEGLLREHRMPPPQLVKIDVEGHEAAIVESMAGILGAHRPALLVELISDEAARRVAAVLEPLGYRFLAIDEAGLPRRVESLWDNDHHNFLACQPQALAWLAEDGLLQAPGGASP